MMKSDNLFCRLMRIIVRISDKKVLFFQKVVQCLFIGVLCLSHSLRQILRQNRESFRRPEILLLLLQE